MIDSDPQLSDELLEVASVSKKWGETHALKDVSLTVKRGESHALVGRNGAGKSSLVSLITGLHEPDSGSIRFGGVSAPRLADRDAWMERVACVYQKPTVVPELSVAENLLLNAMPRQRGMVDWRGTYAQAEADLEQWGIAVDPRTRANELSVEQRQLVEIARALRRGSRFVILDEPTAQLDSPAIRRLFARIESLQDAGVSFLFISHHLDEIYEICSEVTVLRDGRSVLSDSVERAPMSRLVEAMVGGQVSARSTHEAVPSHEKNDVVLDITHLNIGGDVRDVSLTVHEGECVGLAGQSSSGKSLVGDAVVGLQEIDAGTVYLSGEDISALDVQGRIDRGIGYVPEDRHERGFVPLFGVEQNSTLSILGRLSTSTGFVRRNLRRTTAQDFSAALDIKSAGPDQAVEELSGGNQQKVVMARALASKPKALVLVKPTVGVDIASKNALYDYIRLQRNKGVAVLMVTDELDELDLCDRVIVMSHGKVTHEFGQERTNDQLISTMEGSAPR